MSTENKTTGKRILSGRVVSDKMDKTITVEVTRLVKHARYKKYIRRQKNYKAHDENNECHVNDTVVIQGKPAPLSRSKRWVVIERLTTATVE